MSHVGVDTGVGAGVGDLGAGAVFGRQWRLETAAECR